MPITAQYRTECYECGYLIQPGDLIESADDDGRQWQHVTCPDDQPATSIDMTPCGNCNLVHAGECF